jgi:hypothetical protein
MRRENRGALRSELFDIRGRTWVGFECYYAAAPALLRTLCERSSPEALGAAMKQPGRRPYYLQLFILMSNYLSAREQRILRAGIRPEGHDEQALADLSVVVDFFARTARTYRNDGEVVPVAPGFDQRILSDDWVARCAELLGPADDLIAVQRFVARLALYLFLLHGEQRDGNFDHGPYPLDDGRFLLIRELNDLDNGFLPWAETANPLSISNVCVAYALRDVEAAFTIFSGSITEPLEFESHVEAVAVFTREGDELRRFTEAELEELPRRAAQLQLELYKRVVDWPALERTRYGLYLYANHLAPFFTLAGADDCLPRLRAEFERVGTNAAEHFLAADEEPEIFKFFADIAEGESAFTPLAGSLAERNS